ncbi:MAG: hypothetical protein ACRD5M_13025 [Candidatus Acidiferrales bacterium]
MTVQPKRIDVEAAARDLRLRTLSQIPHPLECFIYLSSLRDYNTGLYHHDGLASRFSEEVACEALAVCHREAFRQLLTSSLEDIVGQLRAYMNASSGEPGEFIAAWKNLKPYQVAVPAESDPLSADYLCSNLKVALAILESHFQPHRASAQVA